MQKSRVPCGKSTSVTSIECLAHKQFFKVRVDRDTIPIMQGRKNPESSSLASLNQL